MNVSSLNSNILFHCFLLSVRCLRTNSVYGLHNFFAKCTNISSLNSRAMINSINNSSGILDYAVSAANGNWFVTLNGTSYTANDIPTTGSYQYGSAIILKRSSSSIIVLLFSPSTGNPVRNGYDNDAWGEWRDFAGNTVP